MKTINILFVVLLLAACKDKATPLTPEDKPSEQKNLTITVDGNVRNYTLFLPNGYNNAGKLPLIYCLHGGSGNPDGMIQLADFRAIANRDKVALVYPAGLQNNWNDGRPTTPNLAGINDVNFFSQMTDFLIANYPINAAKIYATGISNGGFMSSRLGCELSNKIAAIAVDAATMEQTTVFSACNPGRPVPAMYIHGTLDPLVPILGGVMTAGAGGTITSHVQSIAKWVSINNCNTIPTITNLPDLVNDGTTIRETKYVGGTNGAEVVSYVVVGGGHTWPQGSQYLSEAIIGKTSLDMNACEVIWEFFKKHSR
jgi:polyhydroxybutyrate depolymerase